VSLDTIKGFHFSLYKCCLMILWLLQEVNRWVSRFLMAHQHYLGPSVPLQVYIILAFCDFHYYVIKSSLLQYTANFVCCLQTECFWTGPEFYGNRPKHVWAWLPRPHARTDQHLSIYTIGMCLLPSLVVFCICCTFKTCFLLIIITRDYFNATASNWNTSAHSRPLASRFVQRPAVKSEGGCFLAWIM